MGRPTENGGARYLAGNEATSRLTCRPKPGGGAPAGPQARPGPRPGGTGAAGTPPTPPIPVTCSSSRMSRDKICRFVIAGPFRHEEGRATRSRSCRATKRSAYSHPFRPLGETQLVSGGKKDPVLITSTKIMTPTASPSITDHWILAPITRRNEIRDGRIYDTRAWPLI